MRWKGRLFSPYGFIFFDLVFFRATACFCLALARALALFGMRTGRPPSAALGSILSFFNKLPNPQKKKTSNVS